MKHHDAISRNGLVNKTCPAESQDADIQAAVLADERAAKWMEGKQVVKVIVVPKKIINIVLK